MPLLLILLGFIALPLIEIGVFIAVGSEIGVLWTLALVILASVLGIALVRRQSFQTLQSARLEARAGRVPEREIVHGAMIVLAGLLLILPGFVTDVAGLLLLIRPVRDVLWNRLRSSLVVRTSTGGRAAPMPQRPSVVDLSLGEFERRQSDAADPTSPWREIAGDDEDRGARPGPDNKATRLN